MKNTVTPEQVKENMQDVIVRTLDDFEKPTTYVAIRMKNGFILHESTTCVDPENYDEEIGKEICLKRLENQVWYLVEFEEKALIKRTIECEVEAESEEDAELQIKNGNYSFIDSWDDDEISNEFIGITSIEEFDDD